MSDAVVYTDKDFVAVQRVLGYRPGDYRYDPFWIKRGYSGKAMFWDLPKKKWRFVHEGDKFFLEDDGTVRWEPV